MNHSLDDICVITLVESEYYESEITDNVIKDKRRMRDPLITQLQLEQIVASASNVDRLEANHFCYISFLFLINQNFDILLHL